MYCLKHTWLFPGNSAAKKGHHAMDGYANFGRRDDELSTWSDRRSGGPEAWRHASGPLYLRPDQVVNESLGTHFFVSRWVVVMLGGQKNQFVLVPDLAFFTANM